MQFVPTGRGQSEFPNLTLLKHPTFLPVFASSPVQAVLLMNELAIILTIPVGWERTLVSGRPPKLIRLVHLDR